MYIFNEKDSVMLKKIFAFTLSEVLITMTIIGVVAALTIPTLNYQRIKKEYSTKIKNFYSKVDNAILDMEQEQGSFKDMKKPVDGSGYDWYMKYLDPHIGHQYVKGQNIYFRDGSAIVQLYSGGCLDLVYDVNADKKPNKEGYDRFRFLFCFTPENRKSWFGNENIYWGTYGQSGTAASGAPRASALAACKASGSACTRLLQFDNWEFKSDYPYKF